MGRDAITGLVVLAASLAFFWGTLGLERHPMVPVGPAFYPRIVLGITAAMGLMLFVVALAARRKSAAARPAAPSGLRYGLVVAAFAVFAVYVVALPWLGFRIATFAFMVGMQSLLEPPRSPRDWVLMLLVALAATVAIYFAFERYLLVLLPRGAWTDF